MANYDKPAFTWNSGVKTINLDVMVNDFDIPVGVNDITPDLYVAVFNGGTTGGGGGDPVNGYGYGLSG